MAPQLSWIGLGNMGRGMCKVCLLINEYIDLVLMNLAEPRRERRLVQATYHLQPHEYSSGAAI